MSPRTAPGWEGLQGPTPSQPWACGREGWRVPRPGPAHAAGPRRSPEPKPTRRAARDRTPRRTRSPRRSGRGVRGPRRAAQAQGWASRGQGPACSASAVSSGAPGPRLRRVPCRTGLPRRSSWGCARPRRGSPGARVGVSRPGARLFGLGGLQRCTRPAAPPGSVPDAIARTRFAGRVPGVCPPDTPPPRPGSRSRTGRRYGEGAGQLRDARVSFHVVDGRMTFAALAGSGW
ncbi:hypothetical protein M2156_000956 [Streptomyces sp. SAI-149]|nr:hypothetical protein [Streptomyces sp. SAI-119]MDH6494737.1 hypothetical protein [Streptomyces sp. SAI-149]